MCNLVTALNPSESPLAEEDFVEFLEEVGDQLQNLDELFIDNTLEKAKRDQAFRAFHTLKGAAGLCGFAKVELVAHAAEHILDAQRKDAQLHPEAVDGLRLASSALRSMIGTLEKTGVEPEPSEAILERLAGLAEHLRKPRETQTAEVVEIPAIGRLFIEQGNVTEEDVTKARAAQMAGDQRRLGEILVAEGKLSDDNVQAALENQRTEEVRAATTAPGDLPRLAGRLRTLLTTLSCAVEHAEPIQPIVSQFDQVVAELEGVADRLVNRPLEAVWRSLKRAAESLAAQQGKQVHVTMTGGELVVPRAVAANLKSLSIHIIRNAIDHGLEPPQQRLQAGKSEAGSVAIEGTIAAKALWLTIRDDGRGIDLDAVCNAAIHKGHTTREELAGWTNAQRMELLFLPGCSTAKTLTAVSGRGVGMDAVRQLVQRMGGTIHLTSRYGEGTGVHMRIPLEKRPSGPTFRTSSGT